MSPDWADKPEAVPYSQLDNPQTLNHYSYASNNPVSSDDPDGHDFLSASGGPGSSRNCTGTGSGFLLCYGLGDWEKNLRTASRQSAQQQNGEGSSSNVDKHNALADAAYDEAKERVQLGHKAMAQPKCNVFVCAMLNKAGIGGPAYPGGGDNPRVAQDWANPKFDIANWRVLGSKHPQPEMWLPTNKASTTRLDTRAL